MIINTNEKVEGALLLQEQGVIRGDAKGEIIATPADYMCEAVTDTRKGSSESYSPYPSDTVNWDRPTVKPVVGVPFK